MKNHQFKLLGILLLLLFLLTGCAQQKNVIGTVTMSIRCDTAIANGMHREEKWEGVLPEDGCILPVTEIELYEEDTVFDVLLRARDVNGVHMEYSGGDKTEYIEGIGNLYERDGGRWSGWMYSVNGVYGDVGCGQFELNDGDVIEWNYTCDLGLDLDADSKEAEEWKETH